NYFHIIFNELTADMGESLHERRFYTPIFLSFELDADTVRHLEEAISAVFYKEAEGLGHLSIGEVLSLFQAVMADVWPRAGQLPPVQIFYWLHTFAKYRKPELYPWVMDLAGDLEALDKRSESNSFFENPPLEDPTTERKGTMDCDLNLAKACFNELAEYLGHNDIDPKFFWLLCLNAGLTFDEGSKLYATLIQIFNEGQEAFESLSEQEVLAAFQDRLNRAFPGRRTFTNQEVYRFILALAQKWYPQAYPLACRLKAGLLKEASGFWMDEA
ncbi:hypothetical protein, partial [Peptococcus simiae]|uniref:hypothetical protein n=1 Tax=Peptococcus simiae TaxID=1643805 RepID=UPI00397EA722